GAAGFEVDHVLDEAIAIELCNEGFYVAENLSAKRPKAADHRLVVVGGIEAEQGADHLADGAGHAVGGIGKAVVDQVGVLARQPGTLFRWKSVQDSCDESC